MAEPTQSRDWKQLVESALHDTVPALLTLILTTGLLGGCSYLLFNAPSDYNQILIAQNNTQDHLDQSAAAIQMMAEINTGFFSNQDNAARLKTVVDTLKAHTQDQNLDPAFVQSTLDWAIQSEGAIARDRGQVRSRLFTDSYLQTLQATQIHNFDALFDVFQAIIPTLIHWSTDNSVTRLENIYHIETTEAQSLDALTTTSEFNANKTALAALTERLDQQLKGSLIAELSLIIRTLLALGGAIVGLILLVLLYRNLSQPPPAPDKQKK